MQASFYDSWVWFVSAMRSADRVKAFEPNGENGISKIGHLLYRLLERSLGLPLDAYGKPANGYGEVDDVDSFISALRRKRSEIESYALVLDKALPVYIQWPQGKYAASSSPLYARYISIMQMWGISERNTGGEYKRQFPELEKMTATEQAILCASGCLFDAFNASAAGECANAMMYLSTATLLASEADSSLMIDTATVKIPSLGGKNRHAGSVPLKAWLVETIESRHKETPFKSRAEAAKDVEIDLVEEAKKYNLKLSQFNPENAREFADRALAAKSPSFKAKKHLAS